LVLVLAVAFQIGVSSSILINATGQLSPNGLAPTAPKCEKESVCYLRSEETMLRSEKAEAAYPVARR
jgi:hypothetical protein